MVEQGASLQLDMEDCTRYSQMMLAKGAIVFKFLSDHSSYG